ncbi:ribose-phosphate pyrophosphokinase [Vibrio phage River4]|uniref:Ribose-phosphate pyrophosphokinase n=1 Tax=Vibrio phage River4 TaxID=2736288 RepID=A0A6M9Z074_9CAUD|nr:ribose-phosphate pyrophosphokinase [Vibrio phage River4]QKN84815.1 ribose-phosphate pyrophosphokinase [Vibrio phage River4]
MSNISIMCNGDNHHYELQVDFTKFSDGAETCTIRKPNVDLTKSNFVVVTLNFQDVTRDIVRLLLVKDALDQMRAENCINWERISLNMPYIPNARADRKFGFGMPLPVKVFANLINDLEFDEVMVEDPHSDVGVALIKNATVLDQSALVSMMETHIERYMPDFTLCAPDLGAAKKIFDVAFALDKRDWIQGLKIRDVLTGDIVKCDLVQDEVPENVLIVDDISDGGASFKFLAKKLRERGAKKVGLYVTHGIFSKGLDPIREDIDYVFVHNFIGGYINAANVLAFNEGKDQ